MASIISRNVNQLRYINRYLIQCRSPIPSSPLPNRTLPPLHSVVPLGLGIQSLAIYQRCMFSTSTATGNPENQGDANSGEGKKSEESHQSSDAGKPVRGGPVSWFSFILLVATGAGLVFYYDKQKKQHIEGRLLWDDCWMQSTALIQNKEPALVPIDNAVQVLWNYVFQAFHVQWVLPRSVLDLLFGWRNWFGRHHSHIWNLVPQVDGVGERNSRTFDDMKKSDDQLLEINNASEAVKQGPSVGKAAIGGPFNLINHDGKSVTERDFLGNWKVLYFGFTHCPDICPDELQKLASAVDKIKEKAGIEIVPVFISVDPERDTVEQVREYVKEFHPKLIGLTGTSDEIRTVARAYRVYYMKTAEEDADYLVDHSIVMYLMGPDMDFVKFFGKNNDVDSLADGIIKEIKQYKK
uniref:Thioredoxin domain-containing protein n=1 Tax=Fagus sylvatica TaxID=28930 RepID=A0A2N9HZV7_FAGSY